MVGSVGSRMGYEEREEETRWNDHVRSQTALGVVCTSLTPSLAVRNEADFTFPCSFYLYTLSTLRHILLFFSSSPFLVPPSACRSFQLVHFRSGGRRRGGALGGSLCSSSEAATSPLSPSVIDVNSQ